MKLRWWTRRRAEAAFWKRIATTGREFERAAPFDPELRTRLWERLADEGIVASNRPPTVDSPQSDTSVHVEATAAGAVASQTKLATKRSRVEAFAAAVGQEPRRSSRPSDPAPGRGGHVDDGGRPGRSRHAVDHGPRSRLSDDPELMEAVELVGRLRAAGAVTPRPEFNAELRHLLLEQAAARAATTIPTVMPSLRENSDDPPEREDDDASVTDIRHRHGRRIRLVASTAALVLLGGGIGSAAAAQQATRGDLLYGMKRSIENVSTTVSVGDDSRGRRELDHARIRLIEIRKLVANGGDVSTINGTLADFTAQSRDGITRLVTSYQQTGDPAAITTVTAFITTARQAIGELAPKLPPESLKPAVEALASLEDMAQRTSAACPKCEKPKPAKNAGPPSAIKPGTEPTPTKTPSGPVVPTRPTPGTSSWPWPFPTLGVPLLPTINPPSVIQTLLPPWK